MLWRPSSGVVERSRFARKRWLVGGAAIVLLGVLRSVLAARAVARSEEQTSQRALTANSANVVSRLQLALQHEEDLVVDLGAFLVTTPRPTNAVFNAWLASTRAFVRYPEAKGIARLVLIPAAQLPAYATRAKLDPAETLSADGSFTVVPAGKRPFYCFVDLVSTAPGPGAPTPAGTDYCANPAYRAGIMSARDSGLGAYQPYTAGPLRLLAIQTPVYRGGVVPTTVAARRAAFSGWIALALEPGVILKTALEEQPRMAVALSYTRGSSPVTVDAGHMPEHATAQTVDLHNGWLVRTFEATPSSGLFSHANTLAVLLGGSSMTMLLGLIGFVLVTGRTRAFRLVDEQTVELRSQSKQLQRTIDELEAAQKVKDEFIGLVSHELRTPLTSISGFTELLQDEELTDVQRKHLGVIASNSMRLVKLVDDLLLVAQIQSGGLPLQVGEVLLNDLLARSDEAAKPFAATRHIEVDIDAEPGIAAQGDQARLGQMLDNLLSNAIKYTPDGGNVKVTMRQEGDTAKISIKDTGIGIPAEDQAQMFGRFFRSSNARASGIQGTGLGLAITRGIVEAHGGTIDFDSVQGSGTTFRVTLPRAHRVEVAVG